MNLESTASNPRVRRMPLPEAPHPAMLADFSILMVSVDFKVDDLIVFLDEDGDPLLYFSIHWLDEDHGSHVEAVWRSDGHRMYDWAERVPEALTATEEWFADEYRDTCEALGIDMKLLRYAVG